MGAFSRDWDDIMSLSDYDFTEEESLDESGELKEFKNTSALNAIETARDAIERSANSNPPIEEPSFISKSHAGETSASKYRSLPLDIEKAERCDDTRGYNVSSGKRMRLAVSATVDLCESEIERQCLNTETRDRARSPKHFASHYEIAAKIHDLPRSTGKRQRHRTLDSRSRRHLAGEHRRRGAHDEESRHFSLRMRDPHSAPGKSPLSKRRSPVRLRNLSVQEELNAMLQREKLKLDMISRERNFRTSSKNRWASVLAFSCTGKSGAYGSQITWQYLLQEGPELRKTFENRPRTSLLASAAREAVLRGENLVAALESAEETLAWLKLHSVLKLRLMNHDPIFRTAGAVLDNLKLKLAPIMMCRNGTDKRSLGDMLRRSATDDIADSLTLCLILLSRIHRMMMYRVSGRKDSSMIDPRGYMREYTPGECMAGILHYVDAHAKTCSDRACNLYISCTLMPVYVHGRYFRCNSAFDM